MMKEDRVFAIGLVVIILFALYYEVSVWRECRQTNSWFYCMRVLGGVQH